MAAAVLEAAAEAAVAAVHSAALAAEAAVAAVHSAVSAAEGLRGAVLEAVLAADRRVVTMDTADPAEAPASTLYLPRDGFITAEVAYIAEAAARAWAAAQVWW